HVAHQRAARRGEPLGADVPIQSPGEPALSDALPLGAAFDRVLGQSLHPALRGVGLFPGGALRLSRADRRRETDRRIVTAGFGCTSGLSFDTLDKSCRANRSCQWLVSAVFAPRFVLPPRFYLLQPAP